MKNLKHTPGPWEVGIIDSYVTGKFHVKESTYENEKYDVCLMAAAPELLELAIQYYNEYCESCLNGSCVMLCKDKREVADIIEKATGQKIED